MVIKYFYSFCMQACQIQICHLGGPRFRIRSLLTLYGCRILYWEYWSTKIVTSISLGINSYYYCYDLYALEVRTVLFHFSTMRGYNEFIWSSLISFVAQPRKVEQDIVTSETHMNRFKSNGNIFNLKIGNHCLSPCLCVTLDQHTIRTLTHTYRKSIYQVWICDIFCQEHTGSHARIKNYFGNA